MTDESANSSPAPTPRVPPLAESLNLADLLNADGSIR